MTGLALEERIEQMYPKLTKLERAIASYMLNNVRLLPFENAASIAENVGVSQMTVGRFLRTLGYSGIGDVKADLRKSVFRPGMLITDRLERLAAESAAPDNLQTNLRLEIEALVSVYEFVGTPLWDRAIKMLSGGDRVFVAGFQTLGGVASDFAARLCYLRPGVVVLDGRDGTFAELFASRAENPCLVLFEMRRYTKYSQILAEHAKAQGVDLIVICDRHCYWVREYTSNIFSLNTESTLFWDNQAPFVSLANLMFDQIARRLQDSVGVRLKAMAELQRKFGAFGD